MNLQIKTNSGFIEVSTDTPSLVPSKCRGCGKEIYWTKTVNGKNMPVSMLGNGELVCHFYDCSKASNFRKPKVEEKKEESFDDRVLCLHCKREFMDNSGDKFVCPNCESDLEEV